MGRPRKFDQTEIVDRALGAFWKLGYDGCSVQALVKATGLQRQSLYGVFKNKAGLFEAVLDRYGALVEKELLLLQSPDAGLDELSAFMRASLKNQASLGGGACLFVTTAFGPYGQDPKIAAAIEKGAGDLRACFENLVTREIQRQHLRPGLDPKIVSAFLYCTLNGLSALSKTGGSAAQLETSLELALNSLTPENP